MARYNLFVLEVPLNTNQCHMFGDWHIVCFCRNNETSEWTESQTFASSDVRTIVTQLQPYTEYQFQLMMQNESLLRSDWITTDMDGMNNIYRIHIGAI